MRKAGIDDIPLIQSMAETVFRETYKNLISPAQMEYMMDMMYSAKNLKWQMTERHDTFFLIDGKGYVSYRPDGRTEDGRPRYHLEKLYVLPLFQRQGLGLQLFNQVISAVREDEKMKSTGSIRIELNVNRGNPAVPFYEHLGMHKDRQGDFHIGNGFYMNDYIMAIDVQSDASL